MPCMTPAESLRGVRCCNDADHRRCCRGDVRESDEDTKRVVIVTYRVIVGDLSSLKQSPIDRFLIVNSVERLLLVFITQRIKYDL